jgi:hypothetical protein
VQSLSKPSHSNLKGFCHHCHKLNATYVTNDNYWMLKVATGTGLWYI